MEKDGPAARVNERDLSVITREHEGAFEVHEETLDNPLKMTFIEDDHNVRGLRMKY